MLGKTKGKHIVTAADRSLPKDCPKGKLLPQRKRRNGNTNTSKRTALASFTGSDGYSEGCDHGKLIQWSEAPVNFDGSLKQNPAQQGSHCDPGTYLTVSSFKSCTGKSYCSLAFWDVNCSQNRQGSEANFQSSNSIFNPVIVPQV